MSYDYRLIKKGYYSDVLSSGNPVQIFWHTQKFSKVAEKIISNKNSKILDVGCSSGMLFNFIKRPFKEAIGIDISKSQKNFLKKIKK